MSHMCSMSLEIENRRFHFDQRKAIHFNEFAITIEDVHDFAETVEETQEEDFAMAEEDVHDFIVTSEDVCNSHGLQYCRRHSRFFSVTKEDPTRFFCICERRS